VVKKEIFAELREAAGGPEDLLDSRIEVLEGDLPNVPPLPVDTDIVVHCAGDVSFDPPIDQAFTTNVIGTKALLDRLIAACSDEHGTLVKVPHYVHISTAYTAGRRRGAIPEAPHVHSIDYDAETQAGLAMRDLIEAESRTSARLTKLRKEAEREHRQAGFLTTAADTERRRTDWVQAELVKAGTERARSLGWTDVYTFTKALGERVVADVGSQIQVSVVRPAIVESSWLHPYPGWIEGFKMAEPLILAYGRGELPEFPASPDAVVDIVPCDHVVNAIVAVCATQPAIRKPRYYRRLGARNPVTFRDLYGPSAAFLEHPFGGGSAGPPGCHGGSSPAHPRWSAYCQPQMGTQKLAERALALAPIEDGPGSSPGSRPHSRPTGLPAPLSGAVQRVFAVGTALRRHSTVMLTRGLPDDQQALRSTRVSTTGPHREGALPSDHRAGPARWTRSAQSGAPAETMKDLSRTAPVRPRWPSSTSTAIMSTNVIEQCLWARRPGSRLPNSSPGGPGGAAAVIPARRAPRPGTFLRAVYRRYRGADRQRWSISSTPPWPHILSRLSPGASAGSGTTGQSDHHDLDHWCGPAADPWSRCST
jgi:nucleoside-diphosphate-sugar epimerase